MPAKSMVLVRENKELWIGCGNKIVIVDTRTLVILDEIAVYQTQRTHVRIMVTDGARVWSADRRSTKILQWEVGSRQLTHIFDCDVDSAVGEVLCTEVTAARRKDSTGSIGRTRNRAISDPQGSLDQPSYTEAMFKAAMTSGRNEDGNKADSMRRADSLPRDTASVLESFDDEDLESSVQTASPSISIPGSQAKFNEETLKKDLPRRSRSVSSETTDSGISSFRSTSTMKNNIEDTNTNTSGAKDSGYGEVPTSETFQNVFTAAEGKEPLDGTQNVSEQELDSGGGITSENQTKEEPSAPAVKRQDGSDSADIESGFLKSERDIQPGKDESVVTGDAKERDADTDREQNEAEFELVDREETRQAFVEGTKKTPRSEDASFQRCASMDTLQTRFTSSSRAPSLMSSQKRKSQRYQASEDSNSNNNSKSPPPSKPWAGRPRLRILAGSVNRVTALLLVNGTLWIGRGVGDVLTVNANSANNGLPIGHVFAQLESDNLLGYQNGQVDEIVTSGTNKVVCLRRLEPMRESMTNEDRFTERYQLTVWEAWGDTEFRKFKDRLDDFNLLVE